MIELKEFEYQSAYNYIADHYASKTINLEDAEYIYFEHTIGCVKYKGIEFKEEILIPINRVIKMEIK